MLERVQLQRRRTEVEHQLVQRLVGRIRDGLRLRCDLVVSSRGPPRNLVRPGHAAALCLVAAAPGRCRLVRCHCALRHLVHCSVASGAARPCGGSDSPCGGRSRPSAPRRPEGPREQRGDLGADLAADLGQKVRERYERRGLMEWRGRSRGGSRRGWYGRRLKERRRGLCRSKPPRLRLRRDGDLRLGLRLQLRLGLAAGPCCGSGFVPGYRRSCGLGSCSSYGRGCGSGYDPATA